MDYSDHYFHDYSDQELNEVLIEKDQWSPEDFLAAKTILHSRGIQFTEEELESQRNSFYRTHFEVEKAKLVVIVGGLIFAFAGGLFGFVIGLMLWIGKTKLPNGTKVYRYDQKSRIIGMIMVIISFLFPAALLIAFELFLFLLP
jgi:hypothetical protein